MIERSIAVVSGKGGAGKTMLAMAITHELAIASRTLVIDLDVFNRGLSGLLKQGKKIADVPEPEFLASAEQENEGPCDWCLLEAAPNVVTLHYPDITRNQRQQMESLSIAELSEKLEGYITHLAGLAECHYVVLDCHGGPDMLSFAAASVCTRTILVSEPDRITFYGTLHFIRRMAEDCPSVRPDVRLVFNKVISAFSERYLRRFYNSEVKDLFQSHDLLAVIPFEDYLSKEFERFPFVTQVYPFSQLGGRARTIVRDLHLDGEPAPQSRFKRLASGLLGRGAHLVPRFMNLNATTSFTAPALVAIVLLATAASEKYASSNSQTWKVLNDYSVVAATLISLWFVEVMLVNWLNALDRIFSRQLRLRRIASTIGASFLIETVGLFLACLSGSGAAFVLHNTPGLRTLFAAAQTVTGSVKTLDPETLISLAVWVYMAIVLWVVYSLAVRTGITILHERRYFEGILRSAGLASCILASLFVALSIFSRL